MLVKRKYDGKRFVIGFPPPINGCVKTTNDIIKSANRNIQGTNVKFCEFLWLEN